MTWYQKLFFFFVRPEPSRVAHGCFVLDQVRQGDIHNIHSPSVVYHPANAFETLATFQSENVRREYRPKRTLITAFVSLLTTINLSCFNCDKDYKDETIDRAHVEKLTALLSNSCRIDCGTVYLTGAENTCVILDDSTSGYINQTKLRINKLAALICIRTIAETLTPVKSRYLNCPLLLKSKLKLRWNAGTDVLLLDSIYL
jgi:hypothetical protein